MSDVAINQGFAPALIDVLESSLASSQSRSLSEAIVEILRSNLLKYADVSILVANCDSLCSLYDTLDKNNVQCAKCLLEVFYLLSLQKSDRSLVEKPTVFSLIWKSLNFSGFDNDCIQCFAAELFASLTFESATPFSGATTNYVDGLSAKMFWQRISENCENVPPPASSPARYYSTRHCAYYLTGERYLYFREECTLEMILSCLENDRSTLQLVYALSTLISFVIRGNTKSEVVELRIAKRLRSLENDPRERNDFTKKLIEKIQSYVKNWKM